MIRAMSLFSGGGIGCWGWGECVRWVAGVEMDPKVAAHYRTVYPGSEMLCASVVDVDYTRWAGEVDYLHASPPCTRASVANSQGGESDLDMTLALAVVRAVREIKPHYVTVENVQQYERFAAFQALVDGLRGMGYSVDWRTYNAADHGVPQTRRRLYLRASLSPLPPQPFPTHHGPREEQGGQMDLFSAPTRPWVGWYEAIAHLLPGCKETTLAPWQVKRLTAAGRIDADGNIAGIALVHGMHPPQGAPPPLNLVQEPCATLCNMAKCRPPSALLVAPNGEAGDLSREEGDRPLTLRVGEEPSVTLRASEGRGGMAPRAVTPTRTVRLSPECLVALMGAEGYPVDGISATLAGHIAGNGDCPPLRRAVFMSMLEEGQKP